MWKRLSTTKKNSKDLSVAEKKAIEYIINNAFTPLCPPKNIIEKFCRSVARVTLVYHASTLIAFQFYQKVLTNPFPIWHFSLAGKISGCEVRGVQKVIGAAVLRKQFLKSFPNSRFGVVGVYNHPAAYRNARLLGGEIFPDICEPYAKFDHSKLYRDLSNQLEIRPLDVRTGLVRCRGRATGVEINFELHSRIKQNQHFIESYLKYVDNDLDTGIFVLVLTTPYQIMLQRFRRWPT